MKIIKVSKVLGPGSKGPRSKGPRSKGPKDLDQLPEKQLMTVNVLKDRGYGVVSMSSVEIRMLRGKTIATVSTCGTLKYEDL